MNFREYFHLLVIISIWISIPQDVFSKSKSNTSQRFVGIFKIPKKTPQPINVNTRKTKKLYHLPALTLVASFTDKVKVFNTGKSVEVIRDQPTTVSKVYGGVLGNVYSLHKVRFYWCSNATGIAAASVDGHGTALQVMSIFYNNKYRSFDNATNYRDGVAQVYLFIHVSPIPNILFLPFADVLKRIQKAGSMENFLLGLSLQWFNTPTIAPNALYYAYPGSYTDEITGQVYYCSTTMIYPPQLTIPVYITVDQFAETFLKLKDANGIPLSNQAKQHTSKVAVVQGKSLILRLLP